MLTHSRLPLPTFKPLLTPFYSIKATNGTKERVVPPLIFFNIHNYREKDKTKKKQKKGGSEGKGRKPIIMHGKNTSVFKCNI